MPHLTLPALFGWILQAGVRRGQCGIMCANTHVFHSSSIFHFSPIFHFCPSDDQLGCAHNHHSCAHCTHDLNFLKQRQHMGRILKFQSGNVKHPNKQDKCNQ